MPAEAMVHGWRKSLVKAGIWLNIILLSMRQYRNPLTVFRAVRNLIRLRAKAREGRTIFKYARVGNRYFWDLYSPGWPSRAFDRYVERELSAAMLKQPPHKALQTLLLAVTKACPLACEHCFEWEALNRPEKLDGSALAEILRRFLAGGLGQVQFSGGEPLRRFGEVLELARMTRGRADAWIITSGFGLTGEKAADLKRAGLTGVILSLDDWNPDRHNRFRGSEKSFAWAETGAEAAREAGLALALSLCATREFATRTNLMAYAELGRRLGAGFIQILEPKAVGHYQGRDVALNETQEKLLEEFYLDLAYDPVYRDYPSATYQGFHQRRAGCTGASRRYLYVDTDGLAHACPFCRNPAGDCANEPLETIQERLQAAGCPRYPEKIAAHART